VSDGIESDEREDGYVRIDMLTREHLGGDVPVQCGGFYTLIDEHGIMMTYKLLSVS
jgi:hypothetical protein